MGAAEAPGDDDEATVFAGVRVVSVLRALPGRSAELERVMAEDYRHLMASHPAFVEGKLLASRTQHDVYLHVTHWRSAADLEAAAGDDELREILARLPLASPIEAHVTDVVMHAANGVLRVTEERA